MTEKQQWFDMILNGIHNVIEEKLKTIDDNLLNSTDDNGETALGLACRDDNTTLVRMLLECPGTDVSIKNNCGYTALETVFQCGSIDTAREFMKRPEFDPNFTSIINETLLMYVCMDCNRHKSDYTRIDLVNALLEYPEINVNHKNNGGLTALHFACSNSRCIDVIKALLEYPNIDINAVDIWGQTALIMSCITSIHSNYFEILGAIRNSGEQEPLHTINIYDKYAAIIGDNRNYGFDAVKELLKFPEIDYNKCDNDGLTALSHAYKNGNTKIVEILRKFIINDLVKCTGNILSYDVIDRVIDFI